MDNLDVRIIREFLHGGPPLSIWAVRHTMSPPMGAVSKILGVTENTIRERIRRLSKFLSGWSLMVNPDVTGEKHAIVCVDVPQEIDKGDVLEQFSLLEDVLVIQSYYGSHIEIVFHYPAGESARRRVDLIMRIARSKDAKFSDLPIPKPRTHPSRTDLQIIAIRQRDMSKSNEEIGRELGVSTRTVERRFTKLVRDGIVWPIARLTPDGLDDSTYAVLEVGCVQESRSYTEAKILSMVDESLFFHGHLETYCGFHLLIPSVSKARAILEKVRPLKGVSSARINFVETRLEPFFDSVRWNVHR